jgi:predicted CoA-binding protein
MAVLSKEARREFWTRPGTFAIVGSFEAPRKLSWMVLEQCQKDGISAVPVNPDVEEVLGVSAVADPGDVGSLAGIVCVRLDPHATEAVRRAGDLGVPVWLSQGTVSEEARAAAKEIGADLIAGQCPLMYLDSGSYHAFHRFVARLIGKY